MMVYENDVLRGQELARLRAERDALLAALRKIVAEYEDEDNDSPGTETYEIARAAIQMVEGSKAKAAASPKASGG